MADAKFPPRVFSGMQPTGNLTLGNYLGALSRFVEPQGGGMLTIYCIVDLHAITVWQDPASSRARSREVAAAFLACGLDPDARSSSTRARCRRMPSSPGSSTASPGSAG